MGNDPYRKLGRGLRTRKSGLSPKLFITESSKEGILVWFITVVMVCPVFC